MHLGRLRAGSSLTEVGLPCWAVVRAFHEQVNMQAVARRNNTESPNRLSQGEVEVAGRVVPQRVSYLFDGLASSASSFIQQVS